MKIESKATISLFMTALIWGLAFISVQDALDNGWNAFPLLMCRGFIGGTVMLLFSFKKKWWRNRETIKLGMITGSLFFLGFAFQTLGQTLSSVPNTAFITALNVLFVPLISRIFLGKKIRGKVYIACIMALCGTAILSFTSSLSLHLGDVYLFLCAIFFALQIIYNEKCGKANDILSITCIQLLTMGLLSLLCMPFSGQTQLPQESWGSVVFLAVISSALACVFQLFGQGHVEPSKASLILSLESIIATISSILFLNQPLTSAILIGGTLTFAAVVLVEYTPKKRNIDALSIKKEKV